MNEKLTLIKPLVPADPLDAWDDETGEPIPAVSEAELPGITIECLLTGPQPFNGREIQSLEEGERNKAYFKFYTLYPDVSAGKRSTGAAADLIEWNGERYKVMSVSPYSVILKHRKVTMRALENET